jgi:hypothetical protein
MKTFRLISKEMKILFWLLIFVIAKEMKTFRLILKEMKILFWLLIFVIAKENKTLSFINYLVIFLEKLFSKALVINSNSSAFLTKQVKIIVLVVPIIIQIHIIIIFIT